MIGINFLESISSRCQVIEVAYILLVINYFSRFIWAKLCEVADQAVVHKFWITILAPIYEFPE